jgi:hypothetical protein
MPAGAPVLTAVSTRVGGSSDSLLSPPSTCKVGVIFGVNIAARRNDLETAAV